MLIDWLTISLDITHLSQLSRDHLAKLTDLIIRITPEGEQVWCTSAREQVRSDSHMLQFVYGASLRIMGSPARFLGHGADNVFGTMDIVENFTNMVNF